MSSRAALAKQRRRRDERALPQVAVARRPVLDRQAQAFDVAVRLDAAGHAVTPLLCAPLVRIAS